MGGNETETTSLNTISQNCFVISNITFPNFNMIVIQECLEVYFTFSIM